MDAPVNMNSMAWVRLTDLGVARLRAKHQELSVMFPKIGKFKDPRTKGGWYRSQLWCLFQDFGPVIQLGCNPPFEGNEIRFSNPEEA